MFGACCYIVSVSVKLCKEICFWQSRGEIKGGARKWQALESNGRSKMGQTTLERRN